MTERPQYQDPISAYGTFIAELDTALQQGTNLSNEHLVELNTRAELAKISEHSGLVERHVNLLRMLEQRAFEAENQLLGELFGIQATMYELKLQPSSGKPGKDSQRHSVVADTPGTKVK